ncbi:hypothetical protein K438DRAFT_1771349 [Mycena galopus ATCC 62051]|nr:hypothetical protein K438DRAFT_1771349 [Mycena galopus ATCC 62051]
MSPRHPSPRLPHISARHPSGLPFDISLMPEAVSKPQSPQAFICISILLRGYFYHDTVSPSIKTRGDELHVHPSSHAWSLIRAVLCAPNAIPSPKQHPAHSSPAYDLCDHLEWITTTTTTPVQPAPVYHLFGLGRTEDSSIFDDTVEPIALVPANNAIPKDSTVQTWDTDVFGLVSHPSASTLRCAKLDYANIARIRTTAWVSQLRQSRRTRTLKPPTSKTTRRRGKKVKVPSTCQGSHHRPNMSGFPTEAFAPKSRVCQDFDQA